MMSAVVTNVLVLVGALLLETTLIDADSNDCIIYDVLAENTHVTHDGETILKCMSLCNEEPIIKWYVGKEEKQSKKGTAEGFRDAKIYEQNLTATMLNKGTEFICSVECGTELLNETITVYVGDPPMIETVIPPVQRIFKGRDTNIECKGHSKEYTRVIWMKDGYKIPPVKTNYQSGTFTSLLQVINVTHDVVYTCKAHNIYGITERTAEIRLGQPPVILEMKTNSSLPILTGESVMVTCLIQFDGNISVMWLEDKEEVSTTEDSVDTLTEKEFHFTYDSVLKTFNASCHAINTFGTITKSLELETSC
ncbi:hemicentin-1-like [Limulus polyphemus]|uniref:Hemicentin-1-like n=1 Tax=Limulus polyphemus TaxID=6850 RepID=A0ABM1BX46_LIMPO|nr:hemicentin-1-like [Limulus polyphemus]